MNSDDGPLGLRPEVQGEVYMTIPSAEPTISRRVLAKGAAWAVPAAAVVALAPAVAASPQ